MEVTIGGEEAGVREERADGGRQMDLWEGGRSRFGEDEMHLHGTEGLRNETMKPCL